MTVTQAEQENLASRKKRVRAVKDKDIGRLAERTNKDSLLENSWYRPSPWLPEVLAAEQKRKGGGQKKHVTKRMGEPGIDELLERLPDAIAREGLELQDGQESSEAKSPADQDKEATPKKRRRKKGEVSYFRNDPYGWSSPAIFDHCANAWEKENFSQQCALILFTSGSTGSTKGVKLKHYSLLKNAHDLASRMRWSGKDKVCVSVPFFHCFGLTCCILASVMKGFSLLILPRFRSVQCFHAIEKFSCTVLNGVPSMFLAMQENPYHRNFDLSSLRSGIVAGSLMTPSEYQDILKIFPPHFHLQPSYGQTETSPCCTMVDFDDSLEVKSQTTGHPLPDVELRIVNDYLEDLPAGTVGRIHTRGYHVMLGYIFGHQDASRRLPNGWLETGDLGYLDEEGRLVVTGRLKSLIIRGGENISPCEVETALKQLEVFHEVQVVPVPDPVMQEELCACLVYKRGQWLGEEEIRQRLQVLLAAHKIPKYFLWFPSLPKLINGKVDRNTLKNIAIERLEWEGRLNKKGESAEGSS